MQAPADQTDAPTIADADAADRRLAEELARGPADPDDPSNYEASCEAAFRARQFSRKCPACDGHGARTLDDKRIAFWKRRIDEAKDPAARATLREKIRQEAYCHTCESTGHLAAPERRGRLQRTWCEDCAGTRTDDHGARCKTCRGMGSVCLGAMDTMFATTRCPRCRGVSEVLDEDYGDIPCPLCKAESCTVPVTVRAKPAAHGRGPTEAAADQAGGSAAGKAYDPHEPEDPLEAWHDPAHYRRRGVVDEGIVEAFERLTQTAPRLARVLALYRGTLGNRWGHGHPWGRAFVVWTETPSGARLLAEATPEQRHELGARPLELLAAIRAEEEARGTPTIPIRNLLLRADREAKLLVREAKAALAGATI